MQIVKMQIKNFLSLSDVEIQPGKVTQIIGSNNQGKTSIIKALEFALKGGSDGSMVRHGQDEAEIIVEFDDEMVVRRRLKADGKQVLQVKKGQFAAQQPQTILDGFFADGAFNPLTLLDSKKRTEILLSAIPLRVTEDELKQAAEDCPLDMPPLDYSQHGLKVAQQAHKYFYQRRAEANKEAKAKEEVARVKRAELPEMPKSEDVRSGNEIQKENEDLKAMIAVEREKSKAVEEHQRAVEHAERSVREAADQINQLSRDIAVIEEKLSTMKQTRDELTARYKLMEEGLEETKSQACAAGPDAEKIEDWNAKIQSNLQELNLRSVIQNVREKYDHVVTLEEMAQNAKAFADRIGQTVERLGSPFRAQLIEKAKLPIQGLAFENDEFMLDGCNIDNLSSSKAIRLAISVARAVSGPAKLICIDGAEALDDETYSVLRSEIENDGFQYFITKVGDCFDPSKADLVVKMNQGDAAQLNQ